MRKGGCAGGRAGVLNAGEHACLVRLDNESRAGVGMTHRVVVLIRLPAVPVNSWPSSSSLWCCQRSSLAPRALRVKVLVVSARQGGAHLIDDTAMFDPHILTDPSPDSNQCAQRHLKCDYPLESRRGMRKRRSIVPVLGLQH